MKKEIETLIKYETWTFIPKDDITSGQYPLKKNKFIRTNKILIIRSLDLRLDG